ncbi:MAG: hypothetical protein V3T05_03360, partial [Myxococcota bacterium]
MIILSERIDQNVAIDELGMVIVVSDTVCGTMTESSLCEEDRMSGPPGAGKSPGSDRPPEPASDTGPARTFKPQTLYEVEPGSVTVDSARAYLRLIEPGKAGDVAFDRFVDNFNRYRDRFSPAALEVMEQALARPRKAWNPIKGAEGTSIRFPQYDRMLEDGVLTMMVGVGYDDNWSFFGGDNDDNHADYLVAARRYIVAELSAKGLVPAASLSDEQLSDLGLLRAQLDGRFYNLVGQRHDRATGKPYPVVVKIVQGGKGEAGVRAAKLFAERFGYEDVVVYSGHGRHGTGPDFDDIGSSRGNIVMNDTPIPYVDEFYWKPWGGGDGEDETLALDGGTRFAEIDINPGRYQLILFDACRTDVYLDAL